MQAFIYDAVRTPRAKAKPNGTLADIPPVALVKTAYDALNGRLGGAAAAAERLTLGCVGQVGPQGGHIALVSKLYCGMAEAMPAVSLNNYCVSGLTAVGDAARAVATGEAGLALAGGVESMSQVPFLGDRATYYADPAFSAAMRFIPVATAADALATLEGVGRAELDAVALASHARAALAESTGRGLRSRVPVSGPDGAVRLARDEYVRADTTAEGLARFQPGFAEVNAPYAPILKDALGLADMAPVHAVVHAPGMCDAAALALVGTQEAGARRGLTPRARILALAEAGGHPVLSLLAGFDAMDRALARAGMTLADIDVLEVMEAFAVVPALFQRRTRVDPDRVNVFGGHIAKGHPLGASGAILLSSLLDAMEDRDATTGLVVATGASGIGSAMILSRA